MEPMGQKNSSIISNKILKLLLLSIFILGCFVTVFLMYFNPSNSLLKGLLETSKQIYPFTTKKYDKNVTTLLVWLWPFGSKCEINICSPQFNIEGCFITADRKFYNKSDGVFIHHRDIASDLSNLPKSQRPPFQKWIWMNMESPSNSRKLPGINNLFNLTLNYRQDSDIQVPSGTIVAAETVENFVQPSKNKLVCWIVSNWNPGLVRVKYYNELKKHVEIHTYGDAFGNHIPNKDYIATMASCKFYLSFENSIHKDYITEKLFSPLSMGTVPVVLGPTRQNYENYIQGDAFIHVDDFKSPKELADYLQFLDKNEYLYLGYFKWRRHFKAKTPSFWVEHACQACAYLRKHKEYRALSNLNEWYWD